MRKNTQHLTTQDIPSLIKQLAIPASVGMFFNTMYNVVDTFYAGLISTQAISALTLSFMIFFLIIGFGLHTLLKAKKSNLLLAIVQLVRK